MGHSKVIKGYKTNKELSREIVSLDYDGQVELFRCLTKDYSIDSVNDKNNLGHPKVAKFLKNISIGLKDILTDNMEPLADLCRPYNEKGIK